MISRRELVAPVVPAGSVKDTITLVLRAPQDSVTSNRLDIYDHAWQEGLRLSYSNELVNTKIYRLIMDFEAEDMEFWMRRRADGGFPPAVVARAGRRGWGRGVYAVVRRNALARHQPQQPLPPELEQANW